MKRHETKIDCGSVFIATDDEWLEIGTLDDLYELFGGTTYTVEYDEFGRAIDWVDLDEDDAMTIDVRETLDGMDHRPKFVRTLESYDLTADGGYPERTAYFAEFMMAIWDGKGSLDVDEVRTDE